MPNRLTDETAASIQSALDAGRKIEAVRLYRDATGASLTEAKAFIDRFESGSVTADSLETASAPPKSLVDYGWEIATTEDDGVRLRRSKIWRGVTIGCLFFVLLFFSPIGFLLWFFSDRIWDLPPDGGVFQVLFLFIPLLFVGFFGLLVTAIVWEMLKVVFWREEWHAARNRLILRHGVLRFLREREFPSGEFLLEPYYDGGRKGPKWRLVLVADGEKHDMLRRQQIHVGVEAIHDPRAEAALVADLLVNHTGWKVSESAIAVEGEWKPPSESNEEELLAALRKRRFLTGVDQQLRLAISPPKLGQWIGGLFFLAVGAGWLGMVGFVVASYLREGQPGENLLGDVFFWLLIIPFAMMGAGLCVLGLVTCFTRLRWAIDRNLLHVRSRVLGWKKEHEYVNARLKLARVSRTTSKGRSYSVWQLQLESTNGGPPTVLYSHHDDDVPRLLGTLLSQRTGWPLEESTASS